MSRYTTELRWIVEQTLDDQGLARDEANWGACWKVLGLDDYPIFDEAHREVLNAKIIRHYYTREIAAETAGRFRMFVRDAMHRIMPYYNQLYESELLAKGMDPLTDRDKLTTEHASGTNESESTSAGTNQDVYSDTPQSEMVPQQIKDMRYATNVNIGDAKSSGSADGSYENDVERRETGYGQPQSELLRKYRDTFLNIDNDVVNDRELRECFLTVW